MRASPSEATAPSSASIHTANGSSRSNSAARPASTMCPAASERSRSSRRSRVLPIPGSPLSTNQPPRRPLSRPSADPIAGEFPAAPDDPSALADINGGHAQFRPRLGASRVARNRC